MLISKTLEHQRTGIDIMIWSPATAPSQPTFGNLDGDNTVARRNRYSAALRYVYHSRSALRWPPPSPRARSEDRDFIAFALGNTASTGGAPITDPEDSCKSAPLSAEN